MAKFIKLIKDGSVKEEWINDGNTHLWIRLDEGRTSPRVGVCPNGTVTVDWGDGTTPDVLTGTSTSELKFTPNHNYAEAGDYVITLIVDGEMGFAYEDAQEMRLIGYSDEPYGGVTCNWVYLQRLRKVEIGNNTKIGCWAFANCNSLTNVFIPNSVTSIGEGAFNWCLSLPSITIPNSVTSIESNAFCGCSTLSNIVIPNSVTRIGILAFADCGGMAFYDFTTHTTVPTLEEVLSFYLPDDCEIRVPAALSEEWQDAEGWSQHKDHIVVLNDELFGTWVINDVPNLPSDDETNQYYNVRFRDDRNRTFDELGIDCDGIAYHTKFDLEGYDEVYMCAYDKSEQKWYQPNTITITSSLATVTEPLDTGGAGEKLLAWLKANATKII